MLSESGYWMLDWRVRFNEIGSMVIKIDLYNSNFFWSLYLEGMMRKRKINNVILIYMLKFLGLLDLVLSFGLLFISFIMWMLFF